MVKVDYSEAYSEVLDLLKYVRMEQYNKIPKSFITYMEEKCDERSNFTYNVAIPFEKQEMSEEAKEILAMIYRLFWAEETKKKELSNKDNLIKEIREKEKRKKYNPDDLFKNKKQDKIEKNYIENLPIQIEKEKWYQKIFNKIKSIFNK